VRRPAIAVAVAIALAPAVAGCGGGRMGVASIEKDAGSIASDASEGALVARGIARGDGLGSFAQIHVDGLATAAQKTAAAVTEGGAEPAARRKARSVHRLALRVAALLHRLGANATDRRLAQQVRLSLERARDLAVTLQGPPA
jgi:hypothetical protein